MIWFVLLSHEYQDLRSSNLPQLCVSPYLNKPARGFASSACKYQVHVICVQVKTMDKASFSRESVTNMRREIEHGDQESPLKKQGSRPLVSSSHSLRFDDSADLFEYEVVDLEPSDLPDISDDEERERVIKSAKELARQALEQDGFEDSRETVSGAAIMLSLFFQCKKLSLYHWCGLQSI